MQVGLTKKSYQNYVEVLLDLKSHKILHEQIPLSPPSNRFGLEIRQRQRLLGRLLGVLSSEGVGMLGKFVPVLGVILLFFGWDWVSEQGFLIAECNSLNLTMMEVDLALKMHPDDGGLVDVV